MSEDQLRQNLTLLDHLALFVEYNDSDSYSVLRELFLPQTRAIFYGKGYTQIDEFPFDQWFEGWLLDTGKLKYAHATLQDAFDQRAVRTKKELEAYFVNYVGRIIRTSITFYFQELDRQRFPPPPQPGVKVHEDLAETESSTEGESDEEAKAEMERVSDEYVPPTSNTLGVNEASCRELLKELLGELPQVQRIVLWLRYHYKDLGPLTADDLGFLSTITGQCPKEISDRIEGAFRASLEKVGPRRPHPKFPISGRLIAELLDRTEDDVSTISFRARADLRLLMRQRGYDA